MSISAGVSNLLLLHCVFAFAVTLGTTIPSNKTYFNLKISTKTTCWLGVFVWFVEVFLHTL